MLQRLDPGTPVLIVSDHGFHSWRKAVNLNTWLVQNGYMVLQGQQPAEKKLEDLFGGGEVLGERGLVADPRLRDGHRADLLQPPRPRGRGIVSPGAEAKQLADELAARLLTMRDPEDGAPIVRAVYKRDEIYRASSSEQRVRAAGRDGRRLSRLVADDPRRLAAGDRLSEHEEVERAITAATTSPRPPGVLIANRRPSTRRRRSWTSPRRC